MIDLEAIRKRNEWRRSSYGDSQAPGPPDENGIRWTIGADDDIDALLNEIERLRDKYEPDEATRQRQARECIEDMYALRKQP